MSGKLQKQSEDPRNRYIGAAITTKVVALQKKGAKRTHLDEPADTGFLLSQK